MGEVDVELFSQAVLRTVLDTSIYLIALINPVSKVFLLSVLSQDHTDRELREMAIKSSALAYLILFGFAVAGNIILNNIFHVSIYSLKVTGGIILFVIGYRAVNKGKFFEISQDVKLSEVSIVPLVSPMIAGPATITAVISFSAQTGLSSALVGTLIAIILNLAVMLSYRIISKSLSRYSLMSPLIRLTGLIVATIAIQMILDGIGTWNSL